MDRTRRSLVSQHRRTTHPILKDEVPILRDDGKMLELRESSSERTDERRSNPRNSSLRDHLERDDLLQRESNPKRKLDRVERVFFSWPSDRSEGTNSKDLRDETGILAEACVEARD